MATLILRKTANGLYDAQERTNQRNTRAWHSLDITQATKLARQTLAEGKQLAAPTEIWQELNK